MLELIKEMSLLNAVAGDEGDVRSFIIDRLKGVNAELNTDNAGNLHVYKTGKNRPKNKVMLAAHMDEVGFIVTGINSDGFISAEAVGGICGDVCMGRQVRFKNNITGIIGGCPVHLLTGEQKKEQPKLKKLYIDIGVNSKEEAEKYISLGDNFYFESEFYSFGENKIKGKALDDRVGCAIMLDIILNAELKYDLSFVFTAAEEIGTRGAGVAAYIQKPQYAVVLEATTACDISGFEGDRRVCELGGGTVVTHMDNGTVYDRKLYKLAFETASENALKCQTKTIIAGGNDSAVIHKSVGGIRTAALSIPCRYIHSPSCVADIRDIREMRILAEKFTEKLCEL